YLAFCSEEQREALVSELMKQDDGINSRYIERESILKMISHIRSNGYAERDRSIEPRGTSTIAVPVLHQTRAVASVGITYFTSAVTSQEAVSQHVPALQEVAARISDRIGTLGLL